MLSVTKYELMTLVICPNIFSEITYSIPAVYRCWNLCDVSAHVVWRCEIKRICTVTYTQSIRRRIFDVLLKTVVTRQSQTIEYNFYFLKSLWPSKLLCWKIRRRLMSWIWTCDLPASVSRHSHTHAMAYQIPWQYSVCHAPWPDDSLTENSPKLVLQRLGLVRVA